MQSEEEQTLTDFDRARARIIGLMSEVATRSKPLGIQETIQYQDLYSEIESLCQKMGVEHKNPFRSLVEWHGYAMGSIPKWEARRAYARSLYPESLEKGVDEKQGIDGKPGVEETFVIQGTLSPLLADSMLAGPVKGSSSTSESKKQSGNGRRFWGQWTAHPIISGTIATVVGGLILAGIFYIPTLLSQIGSPPKLKVSLFSQYAYEYELGTPNDQIQKITPTSTLISRTAEKALYLGVNNEERKSLLLRSIKIIPPPGVTVLQANGWIGPLQGYDYPVREKINPGMGWVISAPMGVKFSKPGLYTFRYMVSCDDYRPFLSTFTIKYVGQSSDSGKQEVPSPTALFDATPTQKRIR